MTFCAFRGVHRPVSWVKVEDSSAVPDRRVRNVGAVQSAALVLFLWPSHRKPSPAGPHSCCLKKCWLPPPPLWMPSNTHIQHTNTQHAPFLPLFLGGWTFSLPPLGSFIRSSNYNKQVRTTRKEAAFKLSHTSWERFIPVCQSQTSLCVFMTVLLALKLFLGVCLVIRTVGKQQWELFLPLFIELILQLFEKILLKRKLSLLIRI